MTYRFLADLVLLAHFAFVLFALLGALAVLRRRALLSLHLPALAWGILVQCLNWTCPLTPLESHLRHLGGEAGYAGGFIEHHITTILYPQNITFELRFTLGLVLLGVNLLIYSYVLFFHPRWTKHR